MTSADAAMLYPCFHYEDVERALERMASKLGFVRDEQLDLPYVFTYRADDVKLMVMTTPKVFHEDRMCYALSGVLIKNDDWTSEVTAVPAVAPESKTSTWCNHPKDFYLDMLTAIEQLMPDHCLPASRTRLLGSGQPVNRGRLLGPATAPKQKIKHLECWNWAA